MGKPKFSREELSELIVKGKSQTEIASHFGVSRVAIHKALKGMGLTATKHIATMGVPEKMIEHNLNAYEQLKKVNDNANELLDLIMAWQRGDDVALRVLESQVRKIKIGAGENATEAIALKIKDPREVAIKVMEVIKDQLQLHLKFYRTFFDAKAFADFRKAFIFAMEKINPEAREIMVKELQKERLLPPGIELF
jgi:hypothetical protein